jgi:uncharacterized protein YggE
VVAEGSVAATPDRFVLLAAVNSMAESAAEALTKVAQIVDSAMRILRDRGIPDTSLRTQNLLLHDWFDQSQQRVTARVASYEFEVTVNSVDELGDVVAALASEVEDNLQLRGIRPSIADPDPLYREAQNQAVTAARAKAANLAESAGVVLGQILSIEDQRTLGAQIHPMSSSAFRGSNGQIVLPPVPIEPGMLPVRASVSIVFEID